MPITKVGKDKIGDNAVDSNILSDNSVNADKIQDGAITNSKISGTANIVGTKFNLPGSSTDFLNSSGAFSTIDSSIADNVTFSIGVIGFKMAVNEGLTIFNLVDGIVDEFNSEGGIDTTENSNATYNSTSDFYTNDSSAPIPSPTEITSYTSGSGNFTAEPTVTAVHVLVVGGGGAGGGTASDGAAGGGAGGLIYYPNYPVTGGANYAYVVGAGGAARPSGYSGTIAPHNGADSSFNHPSPLPLVGEGGGRGGDAGGFAPGVFAGSSGGSGGGFGGKTPDIGPWPLYPSPIPVSNFIGNGLIPSVPAVGGTTPSIPVNIYTVGSGAYGRSTQVANHPTGLTPNVLPVNSPGGFGNRAGVASAGGDGGSPGDGFADGSGGGGAGAVGGDVTSEGDKAGGAGLAYTIADGSTPVTYGAGGAGADNESNLAGATGTANRGNGGSGGGRQAPGGSSQSGGAGGSGIVIVKESISGAISNTMTLVSDTFTANSTPSKARIVVFAEITDDLNTDISASATRDNTTYNAITLTDTGYVSGSSGTKIFTGSTPLTGSASPQVQLRWKITGSSLTSENKIHGVSLQWG